MKKYPNDPKEVAGNMGDQVIEEGAPMIGIFWLHNKEVAPPGAIGVSEPARTASEVAGFRDSPHDHIRMWPSVSKHIAGAAGKEYDELPRGRVLYHAATRKFRVLLPPALRDDPTVRGNIIRAFSLPASNTEFIGDEHYGDPENIDW